MFSYATTLEHKFYTWRIKFIGKTVLMFCSRADGEGGDNVLQLERANVRVFAARWNDVVFRVPRRPWDLVRTLLHHRLLRECCADEALLTDFVARLANTADSAYFVFGFCFKGFFFVFVLLLKLENSKREYWLQDLESYASHDKLFTMWSHHKKKERVPKRLQAPFTHTNTRKNRV